MGYYTRDTYTNLFNTNAARGFETGSVSNSATDGQWNASNTTPSSSTNFAWEGTRSLRLIGAGASTDSYIGVNGDTGAMRAGMVAGNTYVLSSYLYIPSGSFPNAVGYVLYYRSGGTYFPTVIDANMDIRDTWQRLFGALVIPAGSTEAFVRLQHNNTSAAPATYWDGMMLTLGTHRSPWIDGGATDTHGPSVSLGGGYG